MFSAYFARPPIRRGGARNARVEFLHAIPRPRSKVPVAETLCSTCLSQREQCILSRQFSSNSSLSKQGGPPVPVGLVSIALSDNLKGFGHDADPLPSRRHTVAKDGDRFTAIIPKDHIRDQFSAVLPYKTLGNNLSHRNPLIPLNRERSRNNAAQESETSMQALDGGTEAHLEQVRSSIRFRSNGSLRAAVVALSIGAGRLTEHDTEVVNSRPATQKEDESIEKQLAVALAHSVHEIDDVRAWYEIFTSSAPEIAVQRYLELVRSHQTVGRPRVPIFVVLQLLRAPYIPAKPFRELLASLSDHLHAIQWDGTSAMILVVRALRHARLVAPATFETIVDIARDILLESDGVGKSYLTDCCNRILKLISVPTAPHPLHNILLQQAAQLRLVRLMVQHEPELPVTREGYRALINVQLGHKKLPQEVDWARAKALSWPPWREDLLGIDASLTYPGQESRAFKLLSRMIEAGYAHSHWERAAKILAGWDTDGSPTIQTRKLLPSLTEPGNVEIAEAGCEEEVIWAARITATRTAREAWAAFSTYRKQAVATSKKMSSAPFEAMFEKLFATQQILQPGSTVVPGDSKETWSDPTSDIDIIYVDKEPPTVQELYDQMRKDKVKPHWRLLTSLLANTRELDVGVKYVTNHLDRRHNDVLLQAHDCKTEQIRETLQLLSPQLLSAFMRHLFSARPEAKFSYQAVSDTGKTTTAAPQSYGLKLLQMGHIRERTVYIGALKGLSLHVSFTPGQEREGSSDRSLIRQSLAMCRSLTQLMEANQVDHDFMTLRLNLELFQQMLKQWPWPGWFNRADLLDFVKKTFAYCVQSETNSSKWLLTPDPLPLEAIPKPYHLRLLAETLGLLEDIEGLSELVQWMSKHTADFQKVHQHIRTAEKEMRTVMIVSRLFIEGWLTAKPTRQGSLDAFKEVDGVGLYMPTAEDCAEFINSREFWFRRHHRYRRLQSPAVVSKDIREAISSSETTDEESDAEKQHLVSAVQQR